MFYEVPNGEAAFHSINNAKELAVKHNTQVDLSHNGIQLKVMPDSNRDDICIIYSLRAQVKRLKAGEKY